MAILPILSRLSVLPFSGGWNVERDRTVETETSQVSTIAPVMNMSTETDEDLLVYMGMQDQLPARKAAFAEFHKRHAGFLWGVCQRALGGDFHAAEDLCQLVLLEVFEHPDGYHADGTRKPVQRIRAWLDTTAGIFLKRGLVYRMPAESLDPEVAAPELDDAELTPLTRRTIEAFHTLSPETQQLLQTWLKHYDPEHPQAHLPDDIVAALANELNTTKENVRQMRRRGLQKIKEYLENHKEQP
jgi:RNA polymerase sigma factor (sigma-70 family)